MSPHITLRVDQVIPDDALVLIHMGAGQEEAVLDAIVRSYDDYEDLAAHLKCRTRGLCVVSVFGLVNGVTRDELFAAMPQKQFGESTYGDAKALFELLPTHIEDPGMPAAVQRLQRGHFDVQLDAPAALFDRVDPVADMVEAERTGLREGLRPQVATRLLPLFAPRDQKYSENRTDPGTVGREEADR